MRKLASVQKIVSLDPIEGADRIEVATVLGWHVVVQKGQFEVDQKVVYFEPDALLPITYPEFEFLGNSSSPKKMLIDGQELIGWRLKTARLRGQISQGLLMPLSILGEPNLFLNWDTNEPDLVDIGDDVSEILGVVKYEPPVPAHLAGEMKGAFPSFIPVTDETRIQSVPQVLKNYWHMPFIATEKLDGSSITIFSLDGELNVCSRNINWKDTPGNSYWNAVHALGLDGMNGFALEEGIALQGELVGEGIQGNKLKIKGHKIFFFNAYDWKQGKYLDDRDFRALIKGMGLETVPEVKRPFTLPSSVDDMIAFATRKSIINPSVWAEGVVVRPQLEVRDPDLGRLSVKCINPEYLLKYNE